jgi:hypothetical protein
MRHAIEPVFRTRRPVYLFVGEQRSPTAIRRGWTWYHRRLAGKTLAEALERCGLSRIGAPHAAYYEVINLWRDDGTDDLEAARTIVRNVVHGWTIVALGQKVSRALTAEQIPHLQLRHPAARGASRARACYHAHVAKVLGKILYQEGVYA